MNSSQNILFIMCDQLRWDYLSCYGHPHLHTPNIDRIAERGVRFDRAYVQAPICGPSRASTYSGRYVSSHGATVNFAPMPPATPMLGDYLRDAGMRTALVGKTHFFPDEKQLSRLGSDATSEKGMLARQGGFEPYLRDDGLHPNTQRSKNSAYNQYLREQGYEGDNPWLTHANSGYDEEGNLVDGWLWGTSCYAANIKEEHSETPYTTRRGIEFIEQAGEEPWCLHLSYIKPHWPYMVPEPYFGMYGPEHMVEVNRDSAELDNANPIYKAFTECPPGRLFNRENARETIIPTYMALIKQIDDQIGVLLDYLETSGKLDETVIVFTSDHGDFLGDHWLGEKDMFFEESVRVPLLIADPSAACDATRGSVSMDLVEAIDLVPTFVEMAGGDTPWPTEGRSLLPLLQGDKPAQWRDFVICEQDFADRGSRYNLNLEGDRFWSLMIRTDAWKMMVYDGFEPILFDLKNDPQERVDVGRSAEYAPIRATLFAKIHQWVVRRKIRPSIDDTGVQAMTAGNNRLKRGVVIGWWDEADLPEEVQEIRRNRG